MPKKENTLRTYLAQRRVTLYEEILNLLEKDREVGLNSEEKLNLKLLQAELNPILKMIEICSKRGRY